MSKRFQLNLALILMILAVGFQQHMPAWLSGFMLCLALVLFLTLIIPIPGLKKFLDAKKQRDFEMMEREIEAQQKAETEKGVDKKKQK